MESAAATTNDVWQQQQSKEQQQPIITTNSNQPNNNQQQQSTTIFTFARIIYVLYTPTSPCCEAVGACAHLRVRVWVAPAHTCVRVCGWQCYLLVMYHVEA